MSGDPRMPLSPTAAPPSPSHRPMLVHTPSGNQSVGHLHASAPRGFLSLHRPDRMLQCGGLLFPAHSQLLAVSSKFFCDFFLFLKGQKQPEVISLDAVKCEHLNATSLGHYLLFVYSGSLPAAFDTVADAVGLLRLGAFFSNAALVAQLSAWLTGQLQCWAEEDVLQAFRAAVDLKQRRLVTECLVLLLPQFGRCTSDATVAAVIDYIAEDGTLSKAVLTQLAMSQSGAAAVPVPAAPCLYRISPSGSERGSDGYSAGSEAFSPSSHLHLLEDGPACVTPRRGSAFSAASQRSSMDAPTAAAAERLRAADLERFMGVLESKGWGQ